MRTRVISAITLGVILLAAQVITSAAAPPVPTLPFEVYGTVQLNGSNAPVGLWVEAWIDGELKATSTIVEYGGESVFSLVVPSSGDANPGDATPALEQGQTITFTIAGVPATVNEPVTWDLGGVQQRNLSATATLHVAQLHTGWNLIALSLEPNSTARADVLGSIAGKYDIAYAYHANDVQNEWKKYDVNAPFAWMNTLTDMDEVHGYWIRMTEPATLALPGTVPGSSAIQLTKTASNGGWNLVSYLGPTQSVSAAMSDCAGLYDILYAYYAEDVGSEWKKYDVNAPFAWMNTLTEMEQGRGYWIRVSANCNWTP